MSAKPGLMGGTQMGQSVPPPLSQCEMDLDSSKEVELSLVWSLIDDMKSINDESFSCTYHDEGGVIVVIVEDDQYHIKIKLETFNYEIAIICITKKRFLRSPKVIYDTRIDFPNSRSMVHKLKNYLTETYNESELRKSERRLNAAKKHLPDHLMKKAYAKTIKPEEGIACFKKMK